MRFLPSRVFLIVTLGAIVAVTACSSSGGGAKPSASASTPATASTSAAAAVTQIKTNWETFFNPKTPVAQRVSLLQNGQAFEPIIKAQAGCRSRPRPPRQSAP